MVRRSIRTAPETVKVESLSHKLAYPSTCPKVTVLVERIRLQSTAIILTAAAQQARLVGLLLEVVLVTSRISRGRLRQMADTISARCVGTVNRLGWNYSIQVGSNGTWDNCTSERVCSKVIVS